MIRRRSLRSIRPLLPAVAALLAACSAAPPPAGSTSDAVTPLDAPVPPTPSPARGGTEVARQTFEIEPGHTLTVVRFDDDSLAFAETGLIGKHEERLGARASLGSITGLLHQVAPGSAVKDSVGSPASARGVAPDALTGVAPSGLLGGVALLVPVGQPATTDTPTVTNLPASPDDYAILHCADPALSWCFPHAYGATNTGWDYGGWYRSFAFNRATSGNATFVVTNDGAPAPVATLTLGPGQWGQIQYLSNTQGWAMASITGPAGANVGLSALVTSIAPRSQEHTVPECWIASSQMVMASLGDPHDQCALVARHFGVTDVCSDPMKYDTSSGEAGQILIEQGYAFNFIDNPNDVIAMEQALQSGPVILHHPRHYTVLSDYREVLVNGAYVKEALHVENGEVGDTDQPSFATWVDISTLNSIDGGTDRAISDVHRIGTRSTLETVISRVDWNGTATAMFDSSDATSFNYQFLDDGNPTIGPVWASGSIPAARDFQTNSSAVTLGGIGAWLWYAVQVQACNNGTCGPWATTKSVSLAPIAHIDSVTWATNTLTATVHADAAPAETFFRYRMVDAGDPHMALCGTPDKRERLAPGARRSR